MSLLDACQEDIRDWLSYCLDPPEDEEKLWHWFADVWGYRIPRRKVCNECTAPFDVMKACWFQIAPQILILGGRGAGKTYSMTHLAVARMVTQHVPGRIIGGSGDQAELIMDYLNGGEKVRSSGSLWDAPRAPLEVLVTPRRPGMNYQETALGGSLEALKSSSTAVRSRHPVHLYGDEIDEMRPKIFQGATGMPLGVAAREDLGMGPVASSTTLCSTWHKPNGVVTQLRREMADKGLPILKYCYREVLVSNGGWYPDEELEAKRLTVNPRTFEIEYDMKAPLEGDTVFDEDDLKLMFRRELGEFKGHPGTRIEVINPHPKLVFVHGCDWGLTKDWTIFTCGTENPQDKGRIYCVAWERHGGGGPTKWPEIKSRWNDMRVRYRGLREAGISSEFKYALHDSTSLGGKAVDQDFAFGDYEAGAAEGFDFSNRVERKRIFLQYIEACQAGEMVYPFIEWAYIDHQYVTYQDILGSGHPPDSFVSGALMYECWQRYLKAKPKGVSARRINLVAPSQAEIRFFGRGGPLR